MEIEPIVHFDNTEVAFSYKSDSRLKKANFIFTIVSHPAISSMATAVVRAGLALRLPIEGLIKLTVFDHFCGGETIEKSEETIQRLAQFHVGTTVNKQLGNNAIYGGPHDQAFPARPVRAPSHRD